MVDQKILCATDGSQQSEKAVAYAVEFAKKCGSAMTFLIVDSLSAEQAAQTHFWDSTLLEAGDAFVHQELVAASKAAEAAGLKNATCMITNGRDPAEAIVAFAKANDFDHIVVGSAGRTGLNRLMLGSVAQAVVVKAHCPVTVVR